MVKDVHDGLLSIDIIDVKNLVTDCPIRTFEIADAASDAGNTYLPVTV